jgi:hypothetical protein
MTSISNIFSEFINNLVIKDNEIISLRYGELTAALNKQFRNTESKTDNTLQVGSFGRKTGIKGISDLDMLYVMPKSKWEEYKTGKQLQLLKDVRDAIHKRYPTTEVKVDCLVVTVTYKNFHIEVQPVFEQDDNSYLYPYTKGDGYWRTTKPKEEIAGVKTMDELKNSNLRRLCKMARAWKNQHGVDMGGLLIDTLAYNFLKSTSEYDEKSFSSYHFLSRDFFKYLSELEEKSEYAAPGSSQRVKVKRKFQSKAKKAYELCLEAIDAENQNNLNEKWKKVYGRPFPASTTRKQETNHFEQNWDDTEEFIEDKFPVDIRVSMQLDCEVTQDGFRTDSLRSLLSNNIRLSARKSLLFKIRDILVTEPYDIYWKVLNRGDIARKKNCIRGQIIKDSGKMQKTEKTSFRGEHIVECYCIKDGVVIAKDRIYVPIKAEGSDDD